MILTCIYRIPFSVNANFFFFFFLRDFIFKKTLFETLDFVFWEIKVRVLFENRPALYYYNYKQN